MRIRSCLLCLLLWSATIGTAQPQTADTARQYAGFSYTNDFFTATDRYYTQGVRLEVGGAALVKLPALRADRHPMRAVFVQQDCYTPGSIRSDTIRTLDRPFAAALYLGQRTTSENVGTGLELTTGLMLGVLGPCASCAEEQRWIHHGLGNIEPLGWQYQLAPDVIVNGSAGLEKRFFQRSWIALSAGGNLELGTLMDRLSTAVKMDVGMRPSMSGHGRARPRHPQFTAFASGRVQLVGYDATLQGGLFQQRDPHTLDVSEVERVVPGYEAGARLSYRSLDLSYSEQYIGRTFIGGLRHGWGTCSVRVWF